MSYNKSVTYLKKKLKNAITYVERYDAFHLLGDEDSIDEALIDMQLKGIGEAVSAL